MYTFKTQLGLIFDFQDIRLRLRKRDGTAIFNFLGQPTTVNNNIFMDIGLQ